MENQQPGKPATPESWEKWQTEKLKKTGDLKKPAKKAAQALIAQDAD